MKKAGTKRILTRLMGDSLKRFEADTARLTVRNEADLQSYAEQILEARGIWYLHLSDPSVRYNRPGVPDLILCLNGRFIAVELKTAKGRLSSHQRAEGARILTAGGGYFVIRSIRGLISLLSNSGSDPG